ncbi:hydrogenase maturation protease [Clostridium sp. SYSU_GA19001]|uniref:hydrogenase maturation protease n=1 Tax=Clostridium caldaquaticum TaxID=2940653 RepID=UPI0020774EC0|nr:hydrogenase maturation protease [Clostridium caldaquaticum]MCM8712131.1 hydrogenase maturation protease [Clostridium caldaquaticum]
MSVKLIAIGNVLMKDDAIGIEAARLIEERLNEKGIEVIYGEADFEYCLSKIKKDDVLFILDAASYGKNAGEITVIPLNSYTINKNGYTQHNYSFLDLLKLYYPYVEGKIFAIEAKEIELGFGLSSKLEEKLIDISKEILYNIEKDLEELNLLNTNKGEIRYA